jgi:hypothetical protein
MSEYVQIKAVKCLSWDLMDVSESLVVDVIKVCASNVILIKWSHMMIIMIVTNTLMMYMGVIGDLLIIFNYSSVNNYSSKNKLINLNIKKSHYLTHFITLI